jgi:transcriptional regulator with XRE-family HTH domain
MTNLSKQMRKIRVLRDMNQEQLAQATGIDRTKLSRIESGYVTPTPAELESIKAALAWPSDAAMEAAFALLAGDACGAAK